MTLAQKQSAIKRINERFAEIKRSVKKGDLPQSVADRFADAMRAAGGDYILKSGNISHGKKAAEEIDEGALRNLLSRETAGEAKKSIREQVKQEYGSEYTKADIEQYFDDMDFVNNELSSKPVETYDAWASKFTGVPGVKSYAQLAGAIREYKGAVAQDINPFEPIDYYFGR